MGHGIFPNYGPKYLRTWQNQLSKEEMIAVFYTSKNKKKPAGKFRGEEEETSSVKIKGKRK